jgi:hypothetical protein
MGILEPTKRRSCEAPSSIDGNYLGPEPTLSRTLDAASAAHFADIRRNAEKYRKSNSPFAGLSTVD